MGLKLGSLNMHAASDRRQLEVDLTAELLQAVRDETVTSSPSVGFRSWECLTRVQNITTKRPKGSVNKSCKIVKPRLAGFCRCLAAQLTVTVTNNVNLFTTGNLHIGGMLIGIEIIDRRSEAKF